MTPELISKIAVWRAKAADGRLTQEEMAEAILALRADRVGASIASERSRAKKRPVEAPNADDLLNELDGL